MNVYDFDKTIYKSDSTADFYLFSLRRHPKILALLPSLLKAYLRFYLFRKGSKTEFKEKMMRFVTKVNMEKDLEDFWETHKRKIKNFYIEQKQEDDVIISASPRFLLEPICRELGIKHLLASEVSPKTGEFSGLNCHGEEKVRRFRKVFQNAQIGEFYSDSYSDTPLARISTTAFIVKGDKINPWKF